MITENTRRRLERLGGVLIKCALEDSKQDAYDWIRIEAEKHKRLNFDMNEKAEDEYGLPYMLISDHFTDELEWVRVKSIFVDEDDVLKYRFVSCITHDERINTFPRIYEIYDLTEVAKSVAYKYDFIK